MSSERKIKYPAVFLPGSCRRKGERRRKAVICQQTKNLQDNYDYWIAVLRREEEQQEKVRNH